MHVRVHVHVRETGSHQSLFLLLHELKLLFFFCFVSSLSLFANYWPILFDLSVQSNQMSLRFKKNIIDCLVQST